MPSRAPSALSKRTLTTASRKTRPEARHVSSNSIIRSALDLDARSNLTPSTFLLPFRSRLHQAATAQQSATHALEFEHIEPEIPSSILQATSITENFPTPPPSSSPPLSSLTATTSPAKPLVLSKSLQSLLPALTAQTQHYITVHIHRFPYLIQVGDTLRLPFHLHGVSPGDVLRLNRASLLGSRDFTLKAGTNSTESYDRKMTGEPNYLDERLFECRVRVLGVDSQPMTYKEKTKRRTRKVKTVKSKHRYTVLKVMEVRVKGLDELKKQPGTLLLE